MPKHYKSLQVVFGNSAINIESYPLNGGQTNSEIRFQSEPPVSTLWQQTYVHDGGFQSARSLVADSFMAGRFFRFLT